MRVEVKRSQRRRKTVEAKMVDGVLQVAIPGHMSADEERHWVDVMRSKFERARDSSAIDLPGRAARLAARYDLPRPAEVIWSERQRTLWGSCTPTTRRIRIATRVARFPSWVLDYVLIHEMAHLAESDHGPEFWDIVARYPLSERARGYLLAKSEE